mmetsp:Transcript_327/g.1287  ORF Transcript_327/g.1287 Transcript_327/m.1287 type:complete len:223 (-) Transcript_327:925-1593(-)
MGRLPRRRRRKARGEDPNRRSKASRGRRMRRGGSRGARRGVPGCCAKTQAGVPFSRSCTRLRGTRCTQQRRVRERRSHAPASRRPCTRTAGAASRRDHQRKQQRCATQHRCSLPRSGRSAASGTAEPTGTRSLGTPTAQRTTTHLGSGRKPQRGRWPRPPSGCGSRQFATPIAARPRRRAALLRRPRARASPGLRRFGGQRSTRKRRTAESSRRASRRRSPR